MRSHKKKIVYHSNLFLKNALQNNRILFIIGRLQKIKNIELTALKSEQCAMCSIKPVKHYIFSFASIAQWLALQSDSHTVRVRVSWAAKRFKQMHAKINIFYTGLVQNIENGILHRQVSSVDAGLNRESKSHVFFSLRSLYCIYESFQ